MNSVREQYVCCVTGLQIHSTIVAVLSFDQYTNGLIEVWGFCQDFSLIQVNLDTR